MIDTTYDPDQSDLHYFLRDIQQYPRGCSQEEERILAERIQQRDIEARNHLVNCNLRLLVAIAKKWRFRPPVTLLDLIQAGSEGLVKAAEKFDPAKGRFSTYATIWIRQAMGRAYPELARAIGLPVHYAEQVLKAQRLFDQLKVERGADPELRELAEALYPEMEKEERETKTQDVLFWSRPVLSLDLNEKDEDDPFFLANDLENITFPTQDTYVEQMNTCDQVREALKTLTPRQRLFITRLYTHHFTNGRINLKECAASMGITRERGWQIFEQALDRMRHSQYRWLTPTLS